MNHPHPIPLHHHAIPLYRKNLNYFKLLYLTTSDAVFNLSFYFQPNLFLLMNQSYLYIHIYLYRKKIEFGYDPIARFESRWGNVNGKNRIRKLMSGSKGGRRGRLEAKAVRKNYQEKISEKFQKIFKKKLGNTFLKKIKKKLYKTKG